MIHKITPSVDYLLKSSISTNIPWKYTRQIFQSHRELGVSWTKLMYWCPVIEGWNIKQVHYQEQETRILTNHFKLNFSNLFFLSLSYLIPFNYSTKKISLHYNTKIVKFSAISNEINMLNHSPCCTLYP